MKDDNKSLITGNAATKCATNDGAFVNGTKSGKDSQHCENGTRNRTKNHINHTHQTTAEHGHGADEMDVPTRVQVLTDLANLCTFLGAILATLAMASMWKKRYYLGMFLNVAANIADIIDGPIARSQPNRRPVFAVVGCKLDCYSDLVSHFVVPASLLMSISDLNPFCVILAALHVCTGILRQSYFEVTGRCDNGACIYGLTSDYMVAIYCIAMHLSPLLGFRSIVWVLCAAFVFMIYASLTFSLRSRRYEGFGLFLVTFYNILLCLSCLALLVFSNAEEFGAISVGLIAAHLALAYPCYFRFVELNR